MTDVRIGLLTASDTRTPETDGSGRALRELVEARGWQVVGYELVSDDHDQIYQALERLSDMHADVILTSGGTGLGPRDNTPEATRAWAYRDVPGIAEAIRAASLAITPRAMLSRAIAAQHGSTLVINMPGSEKAVRETFEVVAGQLEHAVEMMAGGGH